jgi:hypothetical protein
MGYILVIYVCSEKRKNHSPPVPAEICGNSSRKDRSEKQSASGGAMITKLQYICIYANKKLMSEK